MSWPGRSIHTYFGHYVTLSLLLSLAPPSVNNQICMCRMVATHAACFIFSLDSLQCINSYCLINLNHRSLDDHKKLPPILSSLISPTTDTKSHNAMSRVFNLDRSDQFYHSNCCEFDSLGIVPNQQKGVRS